MLEHIYELLRKLYHVEFDGKLRDFLIRQKICDTQQETLIISEFPDGTCELGLYFDPRLAQALKKPLQHIHELSLAIEGLSHFVHVLDRVQRGHATSLLEMELQAEVDKFLLLHLLHWERQHEFSPQLFARQFEEHRFAEHVQGEALERYQTAHQLAAKFCHHLQERYLYPLKLKDLVSAARQFFEMDFYHKMKLVGAH